jgi:AraC family transcriptional regulator, transcriptional activator of pobA
MTSPIRIAHLKAPFDYKTMAEIEASRPQAESAHLPHRHDFYTIIAVENAVGKHQIDFKTYNLTPNTLYFISPEQVHDLNTEGVVKGHVIMFTDDFLLQHSVAPERLTELGLFFNCDESKPLMLNAGAMRILHLFFQKFKSENVTDNKDKWEILGAWLKLFLLECQRLKKEHTLKNVKLDNRQAHIVRQFKEDVEHNFKKWHQVTDYANAQNLSSNYLNEVIKTETKTSAKDFILNRLILEAKRLARYSDMTAKEIAYELGYEDMAHFSKFFKKCEGVSFSEFKNTALD